MIMVMIMKIKMIMLMVMVMAMVMKIKMTMLMKVRWKIKIPTQRSPTCRPPKKINSKQYLGKPNITLNQNPLYSPN